MVFTRSNNCDEVIPSDVKNRSQVPLLDGSEGLNMVIVQGQGFATINHKRDDALNACSYLCISLVVFGNITTTIFEAVYSLQLMSINVEVNLFTYIHGLCLLDVDPKIL